jgi:hypothetical protein
MTVTQDNAKFIERAIDNVKEHADRRRHPRHPDHLPVPARLPLDADRLHVDPGVGHRHVRAALLRRLHAEHDDVWRMALGIGMIVDAAIVVLENTHRICTWARTG